MKSIESIWIFVDNFSHTELRNVFSVNINDELLFHFQDLTKIIQRLIFNIKNNILDEKMILKQNLNHISQKMNKKILKLK